MVLYHGSNDLHTVHRHALRKPAATLQKIAHFWARNPQWHFEGKWHPNAVTVSEIKNRGFGLVDAWEVIDTPADVENLVKGDLPTEEEKIVDLEWEVIN